VESTLSVVEGLRINSVEGYAKEEGEKEFYKETLNETDDDKENDARGIFLPAGV